MGILLSLISAIFSTSKDVVSKRLSYDVDSTVSTFASFFFALPFYLVFMAALYLTGADSLEASSGFLILVLLRALTDTAAEWLKMAAFSHGDLSIVSLFLSMSPIFLLFTSPLITGDDLPLSGVIATLLTVVGSMIVVYRPREGERGVSTKGILLALGSALFFSLNSCFDRLAVQEGSPTLAGFAMTAASAAFILPLLFLRPGRIAQLRTSSSMFLTRGVFEVSFMVTKLYALSYLQAPYVVAIQRVSLIFSIVSGVVIFKERDLARRLIAGVAIMGGALIVVMGELSK